MRWQDRAEVKKGDKGEAIVDRFLIRNGCMPYRPAIEGPHPFDRMYINLEDKRAFIVEVKTKPRRTHYPDTGINKRHYDGYMKTKATSNLDLYLFFVDEGCGEIYGEEIETLSEKWHIEHNGECREYPSVEGKIIYFPVAAMDVFANFTPEEMDEIKTLSTRNVAFGYAATDGQ